MPFSLDLTKKELEILQSLSEVNRALAESPQNALLQGQQHALREELKSLQDEKNTTGSYPSLLEAYHELTKKYEKLKKQGQLDLTESQKRIEEENQTIFYRAILEKFKDAINEKSRKTVGEIKTFLDPDNLTVQALAEEFRDEQPGKKAFWNRMKAFGEKLRENVTVVPNDTPINCWFTPQEIMENKVADDEDISVLFASVAEALEADQVFVVVAELSTGESHAFCLAEKEGEWGILDASQNQKDFFLSEKMEDCFEKFHLEDARIKRLLYRFNQQSYEQFF